MKRTAYFAMVMFMFLIGAGCTVGPYSYESNCEKDGNGRHCDLSKSAPLNLYGVFNFMSGDTIKVYMYNNIVGHIKLSPLDIKGLNVVRVQMSLDNLTIENMLLDYELKLMDETDEIAVIKGQLHLKDNKNQHFSLNDIQISEETARKISRYELKIIAKNE